jgi:hypothetical protein
VSNAYIRVKIERQIHLLAVLIEDNDCKVLIVIEVLWQLCKVEEYFGDFQRFQKISSHIVVCTVEVLWQNLFFDNFDPVIVVYIIDLYFLKTTIAIHFV